MSNSSTHLDALIREFSRLPGIGPKSASRVAFHLLKTSESDVRRLAEAIIALKENIRTCSECGGISDGERCSICTDERRDPATLCVVEEQKDVLTIEKSGMFKGRYHVLNGVISPLDGIGPDDLTIRRLLERLKDGHIVEILVALNPTVEGDATTLYLSKILKPSGIKIMRMARGLAVGADIEYADSATIAKSIADRVEI